MADYDGKRILVTGGTGSFGRTLLARLAATQAAELRVLSRDEEKQDALRAEMGDDRLLCLVGDVRDRDSVDRAVRGADYVFHAAALKQVPSCEFFPLEAVRTNVVGSENVLRAAIAHRAASVVCLSTDKAVFPVNAMGMSKALMEKTAMAAARELGDGAATVISCVRYGNVMCSRGSVIPLFMRQIRERRPITLTEPAMTRFLMPLRDSVDLVELAFARARQGDLFIKKAPACTIGDLAAAVRNVMRTPDHPVETIGWRHGEKLFETLASARELARAEDLGAFYRIPVDARGLNYRAFVSEGDGRPAACEDFDSHSPFARRLTVAEIEDLLLTLPEVQAARVGYGLAA